MSAPTVTTPAVEPQAALVQAVAQLNAATAGLMLGEAESTFLAWARTEWGHADVAVLAALIQGPTAAPSPVPTSADALVLAMVLGSLPLAFWGAFCLAGVVAAGVVGAAYVVWVAAYESRRQPVGGPR